MNATAKKDLLGVFGLITGIFGIALSIYFYYKTERYVELVFLVEPSRTEILSANKITDVPISVIKANGEKIVDDLTAVRFYLWNNGSESIKASNILKPIILDISDTQTYILDFKIIKLSRDVTELKLTRNKDNPKSLGINFSILEPRDGFTGQLLLEGKKDSLLTISGVIEQTKSIKTNLEMINQKFWPTYFKKILVMPIIFLILAILVGIAFLSDYLFKKIKSELIKTWLHNTFWIFTLVLPLILLFVNWLVLPVKDAKEEAELTISSVVPSEILPTPVDTVMPH